MSDLPIQPVASSSTSTQGQQTPAPQTPSGQRTLPQAPVTQAPPQLQSPPQAISLPGRVISSDPQAQNLRIQTAQGEIDIKSGAQLAPGTEVTVSLFMNKGAMLATITVLKLQINVTQNLEELIPPENPQAQPPLKAGDTVTALQLPPDNNYTPPPVAVSTPLSSSGPAAQPQNTPLLTIEQAVHILRQLKIGEVEHLPLPPGIRPEQVRALLNTPDPGRILRALPPETQQKISAFLSTLKPPPEEPAAMPQAQTAKTPATPTPQTQTPPSFETPGEPIDSDLLNILHAQIGAKVAQQMVQQAPVPESPAVPPAAALARTLGALLPLMEQLMPQPEHAMPLQQDALIAKILPRMLQATAPLPQNMFQIRIVQITAPPMADVESMPPPSPMPLPAAPQTQLMQGEIESVTPRGLPIIRADSGEHFVLQTPAPVPVGSKIVFEAKPMTPQQIMQKIAVRPEAANATAPRFEPSSAREWPALAEMLETVERAAPAVAASVREALPALPPSILSTPATAAQRLAPPALLFLAALRLGDIENWLGEKTLQALRTAGRADLAERLAGDFGKLAEQSQAPLPGGWKMISMPLLHDEQISQMQFFVRQQSDREGSGRQDGGDRPVTRFLLNLSLSRLGNMQLDGFVHQKQFDLILRTGDPLSLDIRQEIMKRFAAGLDQTGMQGGVSFQARRQGWVAVEMPQQRGTIA